MPTFEELFGVPRRGSVLKIITGFKPQPGPQHHFLTCPADIVVYGGARGGGKSFA